MQFTPVKTILALILVYGTYVGVYLASPAPLYATTISSLLFLIFGAVVWCIGAQFGAHRINHQKSSQGVRANQSQTKAGSSE